VLITAAVASLCFAFFISVCNLNFEITEVKVISIAGAA